MGLRAEKAYPLNRLPPIVYGSLSFNNASSNALTRDRFLCVSSLSNERHSVDTPTELY